MQKVCRRALTAVRPYLTYLEGCSEWHPPPSMRRRAQMKKGIGADEWERVEGAAGSAFCAHLLERLDVSAGRLSFIG